VNPLAYDIARMMGATVPETKPVRFFVNGKYYGPLVLTERFDEHFFAAHWGHQGVTYDPAAFEELFDWVSRTRPLTMEAVAQKVDVESLTRWFLAVTFCATRDAYQEPGPFLDPNRSQAQWVFVNWDMDRSFRDWDMDTYRYLLERIREPRTPRRNDAESRAILLTHLIAEDAGYRDYFKRVFQQVMNHRVSDAFLKERYQHYRDVATDLRVEELDYLPRLQEFFERRPAFYRQITEQWLNTPPSQPVTLVAPPEVALIIDGERVRTGYRGLYFPDIDVFVDVAPEHRPQLRGWRLNGRTIAGSSRLAFKANGPTRVEALFAEAESEGAVAIAEPPLPGPGPAGTGLQATVGPPPSGAWQRIPAGAFSMGCVARDTRCQPAELPRVQVRIDEPFDMMAHEVTAAGFQTFATASGRQMPRQPEWYADATHPLVNVTWDEAQAYCGWLGGRLPTEEEWEYAARGKLEGRLFPWGDEFSGQANALLTVPTETWAETAPVGSFPPNGFGLHDMAGNVWEWTASLHRPSHDAASPQDGYERRTIKGGSWNNAPRQLRASDREGLSRRGRHNLYVGFRCVRPASP
jgi:formylglycine-generating enzyme required for sulfatase activity